MPKFKLIRATLILTGIFILILVINILFFQNVQGEPAREYSANITTSTELKTVRSVVNDRINHFDNDVLMLDNMKDYQLTYLKD